MSVTTAFTVEYIVRSLVCAIVAWTMFACFYIGLSIMLWWWLAALLSLILAAITVTSDIGKKVCADLGDGFMNGAARLVNLVRSRHIVEA